MKHLWLLLWFASPAAGSPVFENRSSGLPTHVYSGGWEHFVGGGVAVFDCNNDDLPDIFAAGGASDAALFVNAGEFTFNVAKLPEMTGTTGAYPLDLNADGHMDLFVMRVGRNRLLLSNGNCQFTDATDAYGLPNDDKWTTAFTAWWEDDGLPVLAIGNYVDRKDPNGPFEACDSNAILRPSKGGYVTTELTPGYCPLSMLAAKDARGRPTLRISNDRHYYVRGGHEQMWDIADQRFLGAEDGWQNTSLWGMGIASRDLTGDGLDEVMLTSMGDQLLQIAAPDGTYTPAPFDIGTYAQRPHTGDDGRPSTGWHAQFGDIDNDGRADLFIAKGNVDQMPGNAMQDPNNLLMQQDDGSFIEMAAQAGIATKDRSRGGALADFDNDGRLDLLVSNRRAPLELYRNVTPQTGGWLTIDLSQDRGNRNAVGATVTIDVNGKRQSQQVTVGGGHAGGQAIPLHFGIGDATLAEITVIWPDGHETFLESGPNRNLTMSRD